MQILTRLNKVVAYSTYDFIPVGNAAICAATNERFDDVIIVTVDCVPTDIDHYDYYYINGKFLKEGSNSTIREINGHKKLRFWVGTKEKFSALSEEIKKQENLLTLFTDPNAPQPLPTKQLPGAGYYHILVLYQNTMFDFGEIYWDGIHNYHGPAANVTMGLQISSQGNLLLNPHGTGSMNNMTDEAVFYVSGMMAQLNGEYIPLSFVTSQNGAPTDDTLSVTSTNPVQNKVVTLKLGELEEKIGSGGGTGGNVEGTVEPKPDTIPKRDSSGSLHAFNGDIGSDNPADIDGYLADNEVITKKILKQYAIPNPANNIARENGVLGYDENGNVTVNTVEQEVNDSTKPVSSKAVNDKFEDFSAQHDLRFSQTEGLIEEKSQVQILTWEDND